MRRALLMMLLPLAACQAEAPTPKDVATGEAEGLPPVDTGAPQPPPTTPAEAPQPAVAILQPLTRADFEARLESGAGCSLERGGELLVVTVLGDGAAKTGGRVVDLSGVPNDLNALSKGGRFTAGDLSIAVNLKGGEGRRLDETTARAAQVEVRSAGGQERFEVDWVCGA